MRRKSACGEIRLMKGENVHRQQVYSSITDRQAYLDKWVKETQNLKGDYFLIIAPVLRTDKPTKITS